MNAEAGDRPAAAATAAAERNRRGISSLALCHNARAKQSALITYRTGGYCIVIRATKNAVKARRHLCRDADAICRDDGLVPKPAVAGPSYWSRIFHFYKMCHKNEGPETARDQPSLSY